MVLMSMAEVGGTRMRRLAVSGQSQREGSDSEGEWAHNEQQLSPE
jgi:hypothetical protein